MTKLVIGKDRITVTEAENYISGTKDAYKCTVTFSKDWDGLTKKLQFRAVVGPYVCDELYASVPIPALSTKFALPNKLFACPASKLQVSATGSRITAVVPPSSVTSTSSDNTPLSEETTTQEEKVLRTPWTTLGRIIEGASTPCEPVDPDDPDHPMPPSSDIIPPGGTKDQVLAKASDDDYDFYWMSIQGLPVVTSAGVNAPLKTVMYFAGDLSEIPEGWALCDGQNGTPDLRGKVIVGTATNRTEPSEGLGEGSAVTLYSLYPIMNLSAEPSGGTPGKSAYQIAVDDGFVGTEQEWLKSLEGASAYELAVQAGFLGSQETFSNTLKTLASFPVVSGLTITSAKELPADGDGCYIFENVTVGSHTFARQIVYLSTTTPNHIRVTLLSGTVYDFTTSTSETEAILIEDVYEQSIPIPTFTDVTFANRSDVFNRNALGTIHLVDSRFDLDGYSSIIQFKNDIAYLERYSNDFTLYTQNGRWYEFTLGEEQRFVYKDSGTFRDKPKAVDVSFDDTTANLGATNVQGAIEALAARPSGGGGDTPSDFTPVTQFKPAAGSAGPFILSSAKPFLNISGATVRFTYASLQLPDGTNIHSFEDEFVYVRRLPSQVLEFYMSDGEVLQITYKDTTKDFVSFKMEESIYENVFTFVKNKLITSTTELYAAFEQNVSKCYHLKNMSFQKIGDKAWFFKDDVVSVTWVTGSEVCYINGIDRTLRLTWDNSAGTAFTAVELVEIAASDVTFDDTTAKLGATDVQTAVESLAEAIPIIKDKAFRKTSDLAEYNAGMTYRMINVQFLDSKGINIVTFANDPVYLRSLQNPTGSGFTPALYTMDGYRFEIIADSQGDFTSSTITDAFDGAASESLPFQIIENVTFTSLSQFEELGITSGEMFLARNVAFKLPDSETNAFKISKADWVKASWVYSMALKVYSTDADWHIEWNSGEDTKPFTKIENWNDREGLPAVVGVTAVNINDLLSLRRFFNYAMKLRGLTIMTSAGGDVQRSYDNDVAYAMHDEAKKTVMIVRLNNQVDIFTYDDTGAFTSVTTKDLNDASALPFPVITGKTFTSMDELEASGVKAYSVAYMKNCKFKLPDASNNFLFIITPDFVSFDWSGSMVMRTFSNSYSYWVQFDRNADGRPFLSAQVSHNEPPLRTISKTTYTNVNEFKKQAKDAGTYHLHEVVFALASDDMTNHVFDSEVVELSYDASAVLFKMIGGQVVKCSYDSDGAFTEVQMYDKYSEDVITYGDGLTKLENTVSVTNPNRGVITQAEWDAMNDEEKKSGTYIIDDGFVGETFTTDPTLTMSPTKTLGVSEPTRVFTPEDYNALSEVEKKKGLIFVPKLPSTAELMKGYTYSLDERVVGTWIDGNLLYQRTIDLSSESFPERDTDSAILQFSDYSIDDIIKAEGIIQVSWLSQKKYFVPNTSFMLNTSNDTLYLRQTIASQYVGQPYSFILTILYTKRKESFGEEASE